MLWKDKFKIGIPVIDQQHEELFCRVADFLLVLRLAGSWEEKLPRVKATMSYMQEYVLSHFAYEEAFQRDINYPQYEEHQKFHIRFTSEIGRYGEKLEQEGYPEAVVKEMGDILLGWLIHHIGSDDLKIGEFMIEQGIDVNKYSEKQFFNAGTV